MSRKLKASSGRIFNLKIDPVDERDFLFKAEKLGVPDILPISVDLRSKMPPILDQGQLGSCGPNEISNALRFCLKKFKLPEFQPSRLYLYYFARLAEGSSLTEDTGISIKGGLQSIQKYGTCSENNWGYDISKYTQQPPNQCIIAGKTHINGFRYIRVQQNLVNIKQALVAEFPILVGIKLYNSFESDNVTKTGSVPMPNKNKEACLGGHCCSIIGYDDNTQRFICSNTWGSDWGINGYFTIPYDYILDSSLTSDFWIITYFK